MTKQNCMRSMAAPVLPIQGDASRSERVGIDECWSYYPNTQNGADQSSNLSKEVRYWIKIVIIAVSGVYLLQSGCATKGMTMRLEHVALNVADPDAMARWYTSHLGMQIVRHIPTPNATYFLADSARMSVIEIYHNPAAPVPTTPPSRRWSCTWRSARATWRAILPGWSPLARRTSLPST